MLKTVAICVLTVVITALLVVGSLRAQVNQRDRAWPSTQPTWQTNSQWPQPQYPQNPQRPGQPQPVPVTPQLPPQQGGGGATINLIPSFVQAGRTYAFQPAIGDPFVARVISIDATGWVQVQRNAGSDVGPVADWYNLQNMVAMKAQQ